MDLKEYIRKNKAKIDAEIRKSGSRRFDDGERRLFVLNTHALYLDALSKGVMI